MNFGLNDLKEIFYILGSSAGIFALIKPVIESKFQRDSTKVDFIKSLINEQSLVNLESQIYQIRRVPRSQFIPFDNLNHQLATNQEIVRFTGPLSKYFSNELHRLIKEYCRLRQYIQVNEWEPRNLNNEDGSVEEVWEFNKYAPAFTKNTNYPTNYAQHLDEAARCAVEMKKALNRFQLVSELHLFEVPFAKYLLKKRFKELKIA